MQKHTLRRTTLAFLTGALFASPFAVAAEADPSIAGWAAVPDDVLAGMRGGLDIGGQLFADFAIERLVRIDGQVVARTQLVITGLGGLTQGQLPSVQVLGNLANLIQIVGPGNSAPGLSAAESAAAAAAAATNAALGQANDAARNALANAARTVDAASSAAPPTGNSAPATSSAGIGNSGVTSSANMASSSLSQFGDGLDRAIAVATGDGAASAPAPVPVNTPAPTAAANAPAAGAQQAAAPSAPAAGSLAAPASVPSTSIRIPVGNTGQVIVVSNIPNAAALSTAIQNSVQGTRIDTETQINASLQNSLRGLQAGALAASIRQQALQSIGR
jgi:hypothetical protein